MRDRTAWIRGVTGPQKIGSKKYKNLVEFSRPCQVCNRMFSIFVTPRIADGFADTNNFGLKNCEEHRRSPKPAGLDEQELDALRSKDRTMTDELSGLYELNKELTAEVENLKTRLAKYEPAKMPWECK